MKKPKPPKTIQEVEDYIREKKWNVIPQVFWDYFEAQDWYDKKGDPVLSWKGRVVTWHYKNPKTTSIRIEKHEIEIYRQKIRDGYEEYLKDKSTAALIDLKKHGGQLAGLCGWLIDEIIKDRKGE